MGGVPVKHHTKSKVGRRRSHLALKPKTLLRCELCGGPKLPHRLCRQCKIAGTRAGAGGEKLAPEKAQLPKAASADEIQKPQEKEE